MSNEVATTEIMHLDNLDIKVTPANVELVGLEPLMEFARKRMDEIRSFPVQEETYKGAKSFKAEQNKASKIVHEFRMDMKKQVMGNFQEIDDYMLSIEKELKSGGDEIGSRLTEYDDSKKQEKMQMVQSEIEKIATAHNIPAVKIEVNKSWLNKTYSWPKMLEEIEAQAIKLETEQKVMLANIENIEMYAKMIDIEPAGFVAMLETNDAPTVRNAMDNAVQARQLQLEAKKAKQEEARRVHEEAVANAQTVGDKKVNVETGEVVEEWQEPTSTYQYTFTNMTRDQKEWLDEQLATVFDSRDIKFSSKEV